jgi:malonyl-CoA/methylmalonyl-CoA synthetase
MPVRGDTSIPPRGLASPVVRPLGWQAHLSATPAALGAVQDDPTQDDQAGNLVADGSLPAAWARRWAADPAKPTLFDASGVSDPTDSLRWITAGEIEQRSCEVAGRLAHLGLARHSRVVWSADRSIRSIIACVGILRAGLVLVPVDTEYTEREMRHVIGEVRPVVAISDDPLIGQVLAAGSERLGNPLTVLDTSIESVPINPGATFRRAPMTPPGPRDSAGEGREERGDEKIDSCRSEDPALIGFTSGTTGAPKGAVLTHANVLANAQSLRLAWRWTSEDRLVLALPLFHGHGLCAGLFGTLNAGASAVILGGFEPGAVLDAVANFSGTLFFGVPTMYFRLAASRRSSELRKLRLAVSGSAPLPADLHRELRDQSGTSVLERYGMTETLLTVSNPLMGERRPGSIGFPLPGSEVILEDSADTNEGAELLVRGPTVFAGYFDKPAQTQERFTGGWFHTGDMGVVEDGYVRLLGRVTDVVISGGHNVYPAEVEDVLLGYPDVAEVAVSGTPSDEWGEVVTAWVVSASGNLDVDALLAHAASGLAPYKRPRIVRTVDSLPRNSMGKVLRRSLG